MGLQLLCVSACGRVCLRVSACVRRRASAKEQNNGILTEIQLCGGSELDAKLGFRFCRLPDKNLPHVVQAVDRIFGLPWTHTHTR